MPDNNECGMLEDLCLASVCDTDVYTCVESFIACYENKIDKNGYNAAKAKILAYLSTCVPIVNTVGIAARQKVWDFSHPCFDGVKTFLTELFVVGKE